MSWYKKILIEKRAEVFGATTLAILFSLVTLGYHFATGQSFHWEAIDPIEMPGLLPTIVYSALTFVTLGAYLYHIKFYRALYRMFGSTREGRREFRKAKRLIWVVLMLIMGLVIIPLVVNTLNATLSFLYNIIALVLYLVPPLGITLVLFASVFLIRKNYVLQPIPERSDPLDSLV